MKDIKLDSLEMKNTNKLVKRCYGKVEDIKFKDSVGKKKFITFGGGRKSKAV